MQRVRGVAEDGLAIATPALRRHRGSTSRSRWRLARGGAAARLPSARLSAIEVTPTANSRIPEEIPLHNRHAVHPERGRGDVAVRRSRRGASGNARCRAPAADVVTTDLGGLRGVARNGVLEFRSIPYAAPPLGDLRWASPQPARPWTGSEWIGAEAAAQVRADDSPAHKYILILFLLEPSRAPKFEAALNGVASL